MLRIVKKQGGDKLSTSAFLPCRDGCVGNVVFLHFPVEFGAADPKDSGCFCLVAADRLEHEPDMLLLDVVK